MPCGSDSKVENISPILDVKEILQDWAWDNFICDVGIWRRLRLRRSQVEVDVPMNYFQFEDSEADLKDVRSSSKKNDSSQLDGALPNTHILSTDYENDTGSDQAYRFRMERARTATVSVTYQKGFSIGGKASFAIGVSNGELSSKLEISKTSEQTFQETLTFETNSDIKVEKNSICTAQVIFTEKDISKEFTLKTTMRMPSGSAPVFIRRKKDQKLYASFFIKNLKPIFSKQINKKQVEVVDDGIVNEKKRYGIRFTTTGVIEGTKLSGQTVKLHSKQIEKNEPNSTNEVLKEHMVKALEMTKS